MIVVPMFAHFRSARNVIGLMLPAALFHGCLLAPALLETVAPPKRHTVNRRFRPPALSLQV